MKPSTRNIFKRLDDQRNSKPHIEPVQDLFAMLAEKPSAYPKGTIGHYADQLGISVSLLINRFTNAGISGLTAEHRIRDKHRNTFIERRRILEKDAPKVQAIYRQEIITPEQVLVLEDANDELIANLAQNPSDVYSLAPRKFEELIARLFEDRGYAVTLTKSTRDGGYDVIAELSTAISSMIIFAECKRYQKNRKVGVEVVRGLYGVIEQHKANQGLVITSSFFTRDAHIEQFRIGNRIGLKDFNDLTEWLKPYANE
jgi:restriction endonuclease Mrr